MQPHGQCHDVVAQSKVSNKLREELDPELSLDALCIAPFVELFSLLLSWYFHRVDSCGRKKSLDGILRLI